MSDVVTVIRKDHPNGEVRVERSEMLKDDVIKGEKPKTEPKAKPKAKPKAE